MLSSERCPADRPTGTLVSSVRVVIRMPKTGPSRLSSVSPLILAPETPPPPGSLSDISQPTLGISPFPPECLSLMTAHSHLLVPYRSLSLSLLNTTESLSKVFPSPLCASSSTHQGQSPADLALSRTGHPPGGCRWHLWPLHTRCGDGDSAAPPG